MHGSRVKADPRGKHAHLVALAIMAMGVLACQAGREAEQPQPVRIQAAREVVAVPAPAERAAPSPVEDTVDVCAPGSRCTLVGVHLDPQPTADKLDELSKLLLARAEEMAGVSMDAATDMVADAVGLQALAHKLREFPDYARLLVQGAEHESLGDTMICIVEQLTHAAAPEELTCWPGRLREVDAAIEELLMQKAEREMMPE